MSVLIKIISVCVFLILLIFGALYILRPPGEPVSVREEDIANVSEAWMDYGDLPGITWSDDIHPVFLRNNCGDCHTRGREDVVEGLDQYSLGMIDPVDTANPYYSYRELVYTEEAPRIMEGETLRDGQCCWPKDFPLSQQRRIWIGYPERSALLRKLERDYYDWNKPPRFFGEGLRFSWGLPMPLWKDGDDHDNSGNNHGLQESMKGRERHDERNLKTSSDEDHYDNRYTTSILKTMTLKAFLWFGGGREELSVLPPRIPARDRAMIRYWVKNTTQIKESNTRVSVEAIAQEKKVLKDAEIMFIGNLVTPEQQEITEVYTIKTNSAGKAILDFPVGSVASLFWYIGLAGQDKDDFLEVSLEPGTNKELTIYR